MIPHDNDIERVVIGITLVDEVVPFDAKQLSTTDFFIGLNRRIWAAICELDEERQPITLFSVYEKLNDDTVKLSELSSMTFGIPPGANGSKEVEILRNLTSLRTMHKGFADLSDRAEKRESIDTLVEQAEKLLIAVKETQAAAEGTSRLLADVYERDVFPRLDKFVSGEMVKIPFGFPLLDTATNGGAGVGELVILGAKPKSGKSGFMLQIARQQGEMNLGGYVCSREMLNYENAFRVLTQTSEYSSNSFRSGMYPMTAERLKAHAKATGGIPLYLDDKAKTVKDIKRELDRLEGEGHNITSAFVDYVQLMRGTSKYNSKADMLEEIIYDLKDLATEREIVVYVNAQFNRDGIDAERPKMSDFKGSSAIEMAGNLVLLWTLDADINAETRARHGDLWIEAGRNVATDQFRLKFYGEKALFEVVDGN